MHKKYITGFILIALLGAAGILLAGKPAKKETPACCKSSEQPCQPKVKPAAPETSLEHLSHQFISLQLFVH